jgi:hypothetical protein
MGPDIRTPFINIINTIAPIKRKTKAGASWTYSAVSIRIARYLPTTWYCNVKGK